MSQEKIAEPITETVDEVAEVVPTTTKAVAEVAPTTTEAVAEVAPTTTEDVAEVASETEQKPTKEVFEELLNDGRKAFLVQNYSDAVEKLSRAAVYSVELFGDFAQETFVPHYYYGKALVEVASMDQDLMESKFDEEKFVNDPIIGEIKEGIKALAEKLMEARETTNEQEGNQQVEQNMEARETTNEQEGNQQVEQNMEARETTNEQEDNQQVDDEQKEVDIEQTLNEEEVEDEESDGDVDNSQLAFESLDYARIVCTKNINNGAEWLERQKNTLVLLGQLQLNDDNFAAAIEDLTNALEIVNTHFADDLREIAFINMELARVYRKTSDYAAAKIKIENALRSLEQFKAKLEAEPQNDDNKLLNEIKGLIDEVTDERNLTRVHECENKENAVAHKPATVEEKSAEPLVIRRKEKRSAEEDLEANDDAKKSKVDSALTEA